MYMYMHVCELKHVGSMAEHPDCALQTSTFSIKSFPNLPPLALEIQHVLIKGVSLIFSVMFLTHA